MSSSRRVVCIVAALLAASALATPVFAAVDWLARPGTIAHAIGQPDGTVVYLDDVSIVKLKGSQNPAYFVVQEIWAADSRIIVSAIPPDALRLGQYVDIEGTLGTLPNSMRVILNPRVIGYYDQFGNLLKGGPRMKSITGITPWLWKADIALPTETVPSGEPLPGEPNLDLPPAPVYHDSIASLLTSAGSSGARLECKRIVGQGIDPVYGTYLVLGDDFSPATIKVFSSGLATRSASSAAVASGETARVNEISGQVNTVGGETVLVLDEGQLFNPEGLSGSMQTVSSGTTAFAKSLADGVTVSIPDVIVTDYDPAAKVAYVQDANRSGGMRVFLDGSQAIQRGSTVSITGTLSTNSDGERELLAGNIVVTSASLSTVKPLAMINVSLGGSSFNEMTPGINYPSPAGGLYNKGLLVKIWGRVTAVNQAAAYFYVDDGSAIPNDSGNPMGVKVVWNAEGGAASVPAQGDYLSDLVGISGSMAVGPGQYARLLRLRYLARLAVTGSTLSNSVTLNWTTADHTSYRVVRSLSNNGPYSLVADTNTGSFVDTGLTNGTTYYYRVSALESGIEGAASEILALTPTGGSPTVTSEYDPDTSTYTYTVDCPANNEYSFGHIEVRISTPNGAPTSTWTAQGAYIGGIDQRWPFTSYEWDPGTGYAAAVWAAPDGIGIPENTAGTAVFKLVVPGIPVEGIAITKDGDPASIVAHSVMVPAPIVATIPPVTTIDLAGTLGNDEWYVSAVTATISATDLDDDYLNSFYKLDDDESWIEYESELEVTSDGSHEVSAYSVDSNGNSEDPANPILSSFKIDATAPVVSGQLVTLPNANGWYKSDVTIDYTAVDAISGLAGPTVAEPGVSVSFTQVVSSEGSDVSDTGTAIDKAGNTGSKQITGLKIDKSAPTLSVTSAPSGNTYVISYDTAVCCFTASDTVSGLDGMPWATVDVIPTEGWASPTSTTLTATAVAGGSYEISFPFQAPGAYTVTLFARDKAGNVGQIATPISFGAGGFTVEWLPPISTMETYVMQDGSTVPIKFRLVAPNNQVVWVNTYLYTVKVIDTASKVWKQVVCPSPDIANYGYQANIQTKDANGAPWPVGDYTVVIEGPGIWDAVSGPYRSRYGLGIVDTAVAKGKGKR